MACIRRPWMTGCREIDLWYVKTGHYLNHSRYFFCLWSINGCNLSIGYGRMVNFRYQSIFLTKIIGVFGSSRDFVKCINTGNTFSDYHINASYFLLWFVYAVSRSFPYEKDWRRRDFFKALSAYQSDVAASPCVFWPVVLILIRLLYWFAFL